jgi:hypothetical protein
MKEIKLIIAFLGLSIFLFSCKHSNINQKDIVAKVNDAVLTKSEIRELMEENNFNGQDSLYIIKAYVKNWVVNQILKQEAEKNLNDLDKSRIERLVNDYKTDLFVNKYKQLYIKQKLDTTIADTELVTFYHSYNFDYTLKRPIIKAVEVKVPKKSYKYYEIRKLMKDADKNYDEINKICSERKYYINDFGDRWVNFAPFKENYKISEKDLKKGKLFIKNAEADTLVDEMLYISDYMLPGDTIPYELVKDDLKKIILHKRKVSLFYQLINNTYQDALSNKNYYIDKTYIIKEDEE